MRSTRQKPAGKNGDKPRPALSRLGRDLRRIREQIEASGEKLLTRRELRREIAERRAETAAIAALSALWLAWQSSPPPCS